MCGVVVSSAGFDFKFESDGGEVEGDIEVAAA
jgi:hypothetical protein